MKKLGVIIGAFAFIFLAVYFLVVKEPAVESTIVLLIDARGVSASEALTVANILLKKNNVDLLVWVGNTSSLPEKRLHMSEGCTIQQEENIGIALYFADYYFKHLTGNKIMLLYATKKADSRDMNIMKGLNFKGVDVIIVSPEDLQDNDYKGNKTKLKSV
ncbi:MAG: hypothetical protein A2388_02025 [Candidatus Veblenbacteria bacterium RIFOXYB1_FULL_43_13]|uniref:DUF218 domain-containing protein n=1 Tax=Candidatus Veblenbacteria bacterium RIFOXYB1_FULL_43_13 TaxID=1802426 RepID=A0A1G2Q3H8_9BACT|nr:MAG: hypothetical protein A2388_02025 [Candidatus Veblenbacteria bacterium RIFOXYB1_FULL_43_13]